MIDCFDMSTAHLFGDALAAQFRLRHRVFVERESYDVPTWQGMEYDQFDTPATRYLVWRDDDGDARGVALLAPTDRPYMLSEVWPDMVTTIPLPRSRDVWEGTRFGVDKTLSPQLRRRVVRELVAGYLEFGLSAGIRQIIGVMPTLIWRAVFTASGWPVEYVGAPRRLGGDKCVAGLLTLSPELLARVRAKSGLAESVIRTAETVPIRGAA